MNVIHYRPCDINMQRKNRLQQEFGERPEEKINCTGFGVKRWEAQSALFLRLIASNLTRRDLNIWNSSTIVSTASQEEGEKKIRGGTTKHSTGSTPEISQEMRFGSIKRRNPSQRSARSLLQPSQHPNMVPSIFLKELWTAADLHKHTSDWVNGLAFPNTWQQPNSFSRRHPSGRSPNPRETDNISVWFHTEHKSFNKLHSRARRHDTNLTSRYREISTRHHDIQFSGVKTDVLH